MDDLTTMDPRELVRGLMRGNARELKQGYDSSAAIGAVIDVGLGLSTEETRKLEAYAEGFADGMAEDSSRTQPAYVRGE
jgi:hypothetical protein